MKAQLLFTRNILKFFLLVLLSVLLAGNLAAQKSNKKITISGSVLNAGLYPVAYAIIIIDGQNTSVMTDTEGKFKIRVSPTSKRIGIVSFSNGIIDEEINGRSRINFRYRSREAQIRPEDLPEIPIGDEGINTGYGYTKKKLLTNNIRKINARDKKYASYHSIQEMLEREVSGIRIIGGEVIIHGSSNMYGWVPALIMVDGVPADDLDNIKPPMVESIEVLKDASAAIYGTRGYGGAVLITTRK